MDDIIFPKKGSIKDYDINARAGEMADRLEKIALMLREKDMNAKRDQIVSALSDVLQSMKPSVSESHRERLSERLDEVEAYIKQHPVTAVAVALGVGFFIGNLFKKS